MSSGIVLFFFWHGTVHVRSTVQRDDGRPVSHPSGEGSGWEKWALFNSSTNQTRDPDADREGHCSSDALISFSDLCMEALMATSLLCVHDHWLCLCSPSLAIHRISFPMSCLLAFYLLLSAKWRMNGLFVEVFAHFNKLSDDCDEPHSPLWSGWPVCPISWLSEWESDSSTSLGGVVRGNSLIWSSLYRLSFLQHSTGLRGAHSFTHSADLSITVGKPHSRWSGWLILITE